MISAVAAFTAHANLRGAFYFWGLCLSFILHLLGDPAGCSVRKWLLGFSRLLPVAAEFPQELTLIGCSFK